MILRALALSTLILTVADHWTTYLCLREPVLGWSVMEANPVVDSLFDAAGLLGGLLIDSIFTLIAVGFVVATTRMQRRTKQAFLTAIVLTTGYAVVNNLNAISELGISPLGLG